MITSRRLIQIALFTALSLMMGTSDAQSLAGVQIHRKPGNVRGSGRSGKSGARQTLAMPSDGNAAYHYGATLLCADCHASHASESHGFGGGSVSAGGAPGGDWMPDAPNGYLLKSPSSTQLCLACHDNQTFAPDVLESDTFGVTNRAAGFFGALDLPSYRGHNLSSGSLGKPNQLCDRCHFVGSMATAQVQCIDCHNPHGNGYYRNLWWASDPGGEPPILASIRAGATGTARYETANVAYPAPGAGDTWREITNMCIDCHHTFFSPYYTDGPSDGGAGPSPSPYHRHPGTNTEWGVSYPLNRREAHTDPGNWVAGTAGFTIARLPFVVMGATSFAEASVVAASNEVFCLSCHRAHGSENPFSLRWKYGQNDGTALAGCQQCHNNVFTE